MASCHDNEQTKHANKILLGYRRKRGRRGNRGALKKYGEDILKILKHCWMQMEQPCGKRMKDMLPLWLDQIECSTELRKTLKKISAASIDRLLKDSKVTASKKIRPPKPASAIKEREDELCPNQIATVS